jgi:hypothetical protein
LLESLNKFALLKQFIEPHDSENFQKSDQLNHSVKSGQARKFDQLCLPTLVLNVKYVGEENKTGEA